MAETPAAAAALLWEHWRAGTRLPALPAALRPATRAAGYAIQAAFAAREPAAPLGWKIAATSAGGQAHIGVDGPLAGRVLPGMVRPPGAAVPLGTTAMRVVEPEFAFRMAADLPPRPAPWTEPEVLAAVGSLHLSLEVPDSRFADFTLAGAPQLIADNACGHVFVFGPAAPDLWRGLDLAAHRVLARRGAGAAREGFGHRVLGGPLCALTWLANELSGLGLGLRAGETVTTGTCMTPLEIAAGDEVLADYGALGTIGCRFTA